MGDRPCTSASLVVASYGFDHRAGTGVRRGYEIRCVDGIVEEDVSARGYEWSPALEVLADP